MSIQDAQPSLRYRLVQRRIRPPRALTVICAEGDWQSDALRMMECYSRTWGGDANGLVACSADWVIAEPAWKLLRSLDADHWAVFVRNRRALRMADPVAYERLLASDIKAWRKEHGGTKAEARGLLEAEHMLSAGSFIPTPQPIDERIRHWFARSRPSKWCN
jgi:hypothetical protein